MNDNELQQYFSYLDQMKSEGQDMKLGAHQLCSTYGLSPADARSVVQQWYSAQGYDPSVTGDANTSRSTGSGEVKSSS